jgi:reversibly glycosylated polypeptide/UDP-arabinopyranose mutase
VITLDTGSKQDSPYIRHDKASHWKSNFGKEKAGITWQEEIIPFFENIELPDDADTSIDCYRYLSEKVKSELTELDDYFEEMGTAMRIWADHWENQA